MTLSNWQFLEFFKLEIFRIFQIKFFRNCRSWKINKFLKNVQFGRRNLVPKIGNFGILCPFDIPQFSQFLSPIFVTRKFSRSKFGHSLIYKSKTSAILKFCCLKFEPSSNYTLKILNSRLLSFRLNNLFNKTLFPV